MAKQIARLFFLMVLLAAVVIFFMYWLERLDIIPTRVVLSRVSRVINSITNKGSGLSNQENAVNSTKNDDAFLLEKLRLEKQRETLLQKQVNLDIREGRIKAKEEDMKRKEQQIVELEKIIEDREKSLNQISKQFENKNEVLQYNVQALTSMPPQQAVAILQGYDDQTLIDTLVVADKVADDDNVQSLVPYWLSLMDSKRAATIQQKLLYRK